MAESKTSASTGTANSAISDAVIQAEAAADHVEAAKRRAAIKAVDDYFKPSYRWVGIGSGTTILYVVDAIKERMNPDDRSAILFVPTGYQSRTEIEKRGLISIPLDSLPEDVTLDVAFDGADEVDEELNCVKGGGACLFQEKLVAMKAKKFVCVADYRKDVPRLLTNWSYIPIEVAPIAVKQVMRALRKLGCPNPTLRNLEVVKAGPLKTDQDFYIIKAPFPPLLISKDLPNEADRTTASGKAAGEAWGKTKDGEEGRIWEAGTLARAIRSISGVLEVGLFVGFNGPEAARPGSSLGMDVDAVLKSQGGQKPVAVYFGMQDGTVRVRKAPGEE